MQDELPERNPTMRAIEDWDQRSTSDPDPLVAPARLVDVPEEASGVDVAPAAAEDAGPTNRYTLRQFLREGCVAVAIFLVGIPLALALPPWLASEREAVTVPASPSSPLLLVSGRAFAEGIGRSLGAEGHVVVQDGNGFAAGTDPLARSAPATAARSPFLDVVVQGGEADVSQQAGAVELAALHMIDRLRAQIDPGSSITVVGPIPGGEPGRDLLRVRDELAGATTAKGVRFIDPIAHGLRLGQPDLRQRLEILLRSPAA